MEKDVLIIVKEDLLEALEEKNGKAPLSLIKPEIKVSRFFISKAIRELEKEDLIRTKKDLVCLTKEGIKKAKDIVEKHLVLENYFKKTRSKEEAWKAASILEHYVSMEVIDNIKKLSTFKKEGIPLVGFGLNKESVICDNTIDDFRLFERTVSIGIIPGERIKITNKIPNGLIAWIGNKKFALDKNIVKKIKVIDLKV